MGTGSSALAASRSSSPQGGIVPRVIHDLFKQVQQSAQTTITATYLEIYGEELRDLLVLESGAMKLSIREGRKGDISVSGLQEVEARKEADLMRALEEGETLASSSCLILLDSFGALHRLEEGESLESCSCLILLDSFGALRRLEEGETLESCSCLILQHQLLDPA